MLLSPATDAAMKAVEDGGERARRICAKALAYVAEVEWYRIVNDPGELERAWTIWGSMDDDL